MTDIVERLNIWPAADGNDGLSGSYVEALMHEAAAKIERLRAACETKEADTHGLVEDNIKLTAEIERLRAQLADAKDQIVGMHRHIAEHLAEIERLRAIANKETADKLAANMALIAAESEIERLRALPRLKKIKQLQTIIETVIRAQTASVRGGK